MSPPPPQVVPALAAAASVVAGGPSVALTDPRTQTPDGLAKYTTRCRCAATAVALLGPPVLSAFCHCRMCRATRHSWITHEILWPESSLRVLRGAAGLTALPYTGSVLVGQVCRLCGTQVFIADSAAREVSLVGAQFTDVAGRLAHAELAATFHVHYRERAQELMDTINLPIYLDRPSERGGTGLKFEPELGLQ